MEVHEDFYKTICRVCLSIGEKNNLVSLIDNSTEDGLSCFGKAVAIFTNIRIKNDRLPSYMCQNCLFLLKHAILFRKTCEKSQDTLTGLMKKCVASDSEIEEKVIEYVIFTKHFPNLTFNETSEAVDKVPSISSKVQNDVKSESECLKFDADVFAETLDDNRGSDSEEEPLATKVKSLPNSLNKETKCIRTKRVSIKPYTRSKPKLTDDKVDCLLDNMEKATKRKLEKSKKKEYTCNVCGKAFLHMGTYKYHMQYHNGFRFVCEHCGKGFAANAMLQSHIGHIHKLGRFFSCKHCDFKCPGKFEMKLHERTHTGERPFTCDKCGMTFTRRSVWQQHALYHKEKSVLCPKCPMKFHKRGDMLRHYNYVHERFRIFQCTECEVTFGSSGSVRRHLFKVHGIPRERQGKINKVDIGSIAGV